MTPLDMAMDALNAMIRECESSEKGMIIGVGFDLEQAKAVRRAVNRGQMRQDVLDALHQLVGDSLPDSLPTKVVLDALDMAVVIPAARRAKRKLKGKP